MLRKNLLLHTIGRQLLQVVFDFGRLVKKRKEKRMFFANVIANFEQQKKAILILKLLCTLQRRLVFFKYNLDKLCIF